MKNATEHNMRAAILDADELVLKAVRSYLRTCKNGGMPSKLAARIEASVADAARLQYFSLAIASAAQPTSADR